MIKTIKDFDIKDKKVLIRCDFNVPIKDGKIVDDNRIVSSLPTIEYALEEGAKVILLSHLGRVKEEADLKKNDLKVVSSRLSELLGKEVEFVNSTRGNELESAINSMNNGDVVLIQNTRYEDLNGKKESSNDVELGKYWASLGDIFINDAFGTIHRSHASNVGIATYLPSGVGFLVEKELNALKTLDNPERPYVVILGGSKVSDKIGVIDNLVTKADYILIGGGMAFTFLKAAGYEIGKSLLEEEKLDYCKNILSKYREKIILPTDVVLSKKVFEEVEVRETTIKDIGDDEIGVDVGENTVYQFEKYLSDAKVVVWNGPLGVYEVERFRKGTLDILKYLTDNNIKTIIGGGDTAAIVSQDKELKSKLYHVSTGGGATLEYLEGKVLPGIKALDK
ncbi:MAG: phosphoglycerate kinase [Bacilli bacterium]|nr:phosphoglycerate kinase [Bacilli bacterium]